MKRLYSFLVLAFFLILNIQAANTGDFRSKAGGTGNWNDFNAWERYDGTSWVAAISGQLPTATTSVEILSGQTMTVNATGLLSGPLTISGTLVYQSGATGGLTVGSNAANASVTINPTGNFNAGSGTLLNHTLLIWGGLTANGVFDMNTTAGVIVTFSGVPNYTISGTSSTIDFFSIVINKANNNGIILEVTSVITLAPATATSTNHLTITNGCFKLSSASTLQPYYGNLTVCPKAGKLWLNNAAASISSVGTGISTSGPGNLSFNGSLQIDAGTFSGGCGTNMLSFVGSSATIPTVGLPSANSTINWYGQIQFGSYTTLNMTAGNINIYPQTSVASLTGYADIVSFASSAAGTNIQFTGGTMTLADPLTGPVPPVSVYSAFNFQGSQGTFNFQGGTIRFGDGVSTLAGNSSGFSIFSNNANLTLGNVIVNNPPSYTGTDRLLTLYSNIKIGGTFTVNSGAGNIVQLDNTSSAGYTMTLLGNLVNNGTINGDNYTGSTLNMNGTSQQTISGSGTFNPIRNLIINNTSGLTPAINLQAPLTINGTTTFTNGIVGIGTNNFTFGPAATIAGTPSSTKMFIPTSSGMVQKVFSATGSFTFPVGDNTGTIEYSPVTLNFTSGTFGSNTYAGVNLVNAAYSSPLINTSYLNRYWNVSQSGITGFNCNATFNYLAADVIGTESEISTVLVNPLPASYYDLANTTLHQLSATNLTSFGTFTGTIAPACANPTTGGSIASNQSGCNPFNPVLITNVTFPSGQGGTLEYKWQSSVTSHSTGFSDIPGSNSPTYDPGPITQTTWFKRLAHAACMPDWTGAVVSNVLTMTVNPSFPVSVVIAADANTICSGTLVTYTATPVNEGASPVYQWQVNGIDVGINSATFSYIPANDDIVTCMLTSSLACPGVNPATSNPVTMIVNESPAIISVFDNSICGGGSVSLGALATSGTINWYDISTGGTSLGLGTDFTTPDISVTTVYYVDATDNGCTSIERTAVTATVNSVPEAVIVSGGGTLCGYSELIASGGAGGTIYWQDTTSNGTNIDVPFDTVLVVSSGIYYFRSQSQEGCWGPEGFATVIINPNYYMDENLTINLGDTVVWRGQILTIPGTYSAIYQTVNGCDSIYTLFLTDNSASKILSLKVFMEGLYAGFNLMNPAQGSGGNQFDFGIADQVNVELHDELPPFDVTYTFDNVFLGTDGMVTIPSLPGTISGSYYLVIKHRNSIETWSALPVDLSPAGPISYDFTIEAGQAYGGNLRQIDGVFVLWGGDVSQDGIVDGSDLAEVDNGSTSLLMGYNPQDINGDGLVDGSDLALVDNNSTLIIQVMRP